MACAQGCIGAGHGMGAARGIAAAIHGIVAVHGIAAIAGGVYGKFGRRYAGERGMNQDSLFICTSGVSRGSWRNSPERIASWRTLAAKS